MEPSRQVATMACGGDAVAEGEMPSSEGGMNPPRTTSVLSPVRTSKVWLLSLVNSGITAIIGSPPLCLAIALTAAAEEVGTVLMGRCVPKMLI